MAGGIFFEVETLDALTPTLQRMKAAALDMTPAMDEASEVMLRGTLRRFEDEEGPSGVPWQKSAAALEEGRKTLTKSGDLRNAIDRVSGSDFAAVGVYRIGGAGVYGAIHQFGGTIRPRQGKALNTPFGPRASVTLPTRPYLGFSDEDVAAIDRVLVAHLERAIGGASA